MPQALRPRLREREQGSESWCVERCTTILFLDRQRKTPAVLLQPKSDGQHSPKNQQVVRRNTAIAQQRPAAHLVQDAERRYRTTIAHQWPPQSCPLLANLLHAMVHHASRLQREHQLIALFEGFGQCHLLLNQQLETLQRPVVLRPPNWLLAMPRRPEESVWQFDQVPDAPLVPHELHRHQPLTHLLTNAPTPKLDAQTQRCHLRAVRHIGRDRSRDLRPHSQWVTMLVGHCANSLDRWQGQVRGATR